VLPGQGRHARWHFRVFIPKHEVLKPMIPLCHSYLLCGLCFALSPRYISRIAGTSVPGVARFPRIAPLEKVLPAGFGVMKLPANTRLLCYSQDHRQGEEGLATRRLFDSLRRGILDSPARRIDSAPPWPSQNRRNCYLWSIQTGLTACKFAIIAKGELESRADVASSQGTMST